MVYCPKCGKQNADDATYCNNCGAPLTGRRDANKEWDNRCNDTCSGKGRTGLIFWGVIVSLIGIWLIMELGVKNITGLPSWVYDIQWVWIFGVVIGAAVLIAGISLILRANQH